MFSKVLAASALASVALGAYSNSTGNATVITTNVVVTEFTTYCPESTTVTFTTCDHKDICGEHIVTVTEPTTLTVTSCEVPTTYTTTAYSTTVETVCDTCTKKTEVPTTVAPTTVISSSSTVANHSVTTATGGADKVVAGAFAGVAALAAALI